MSAMRDLMVSLQRTAYHQWMAAEGVPIAEGFGVEDVREMKLDRWQRMGGRGSFIHLYGMEGRTGMYVAEIPPGEALEPEKHLYEEVICILSGRGATEVWQDEGEKRWFEWDTWSLFAPPLNTWHRLINRGTKPVRFLAVTNAPMIMDMFHNAEFVFNCPNTFSDRYRGEEKYFSIGTKQYNAGVLGIWETNFIPNVRDLELGPELFTKGLNILQFEPSGNTLVGHVADLPSGQYPQAHYHDGGAVISILRSDGYTLLWPKEAGLRPYEAGRGDEVVEIKWTEGTVMSPPGGWFHQHFNADPTPARHLAIRYGSRLHRTGFDLAAQHKQDGLYVSVKNGGTMIEFEDEDPNIRRRYETALRKKETNFTLPPIEYS